MLIVAKFGGTSVGNIERIKNVAKIVVNFVESGHQIIVVISAMAGVTNQIYKNLCDIFDNNKNSREFDQAMVTGEQISASLLSIAIQNLGCQSLSYNAQSLPIYGDGEYGDGHITYVNAEKLKNDLKNKTIPVITGFQGFKKNENSFITLGRGGSDYSAVMIAASLYADKCLIYTDVEGVYTADPRIVPNAIKINELSYDEMIQISSDGAKVLQTKSVIAAKNYNIPLEVLSSLDSYTKGTRITNSAFLNENNNFKVVSYKTNTSGTTKISVMNLKKSESLSIEIIEEILAQSNIKFLSIQKMNTQFETIMVIVEDFFKEETVNILHNFCNHHSFSL